MPAPMRRVIQQDRIAMDITANPIATASTAVPHGMAVHRKGMITTINLVQNRGRTVSAIKGAISGIRSKGTLGEKACTIATRRNGIEEETTIMMIKTIDTGIRGTQDPDTTQLGQIDGTIATVPATTMEATTVPGTAIDPLSTDELIALARSVDRRRRAAIVSQRAADATST